MLKEQVPSNVVYVPIVTSTFEDYKSKGGVLNPLEHMFVSNVISSPLKNYVVHAVYFRIISAIEREGFNG